MSQQTKSTDHSFRSQKVPPLVKKFPEFYTTQNLLSSSPQPSPESDSVHDLQSQPISILILYFQLHVSYQNGLFHQGCSTNIRYTFLLSLKRATSPEAPHCAVFSGLSQLPQDCPFN